MPVATSRRTSSSRSVSRRPGTCSCTARPICLNSSISLTAIDGLISDWPSATTRTARATTSIPGSRPSSIPSPSRNSSWSSTTSTRTASSTPAPASTVAATALRVRRRCRSSSWSVILIVTEFLSEPVEGSAVVRSHRAFGTIEQPRDLDELEIFVVVENDDGASLPGQTLEQRPRLVDVWNAGDGLRHRGKRTGSPADVPALSILDEVHHASLQVRQMVLDRVPPWVCGGEDGLDDVLAQVTRTAQQEGQPDQRGPVGAVRLVEAWSFVVKATHDLYVVHERANVASRCG